MKVYNDDGTINKAFIKHMHYTPICKIDRVTYLRYCYYDEYMRFHWCIKDYNTHSIIYNEIERSDV